MSRACRAHFIGSITFTPSHLLKSNFHEGS
jgi:hypothetical protein